MPGKFIGDTAEQIAPELAEVERDLAQAKRDQTKIRYNAGAVRNEITRGRPVTTVAPLERGGAWNAMCDRRCRCPSTDSG